MSPFVVSYFFSLLPLSTTFFSDVFPLLLFLQNKLTSTVIFAVPGEFFPRFGEYVPLREQVKKVTTTE